MTDAEIVELALCRVAIKKFREKHSPSHNQSPNVYK
jgi:hypothetical protein